jgi:hypothetical protein
VEPEWVIHSQKARHLMQRSDADVPKLHDERLTRRNLQTGMLGKIDFAICNAVDLKADETFLVSLVDLFVGMVLDQIAVHPSLNPRSFGYDAHLVPAIVYEMEMSRIDLLLRSEPTRV